MTKPSGSYADTAREFLDGRVVLHAGDCREVIRSLTDGSVDSVVCDPPYALVSIVKRFGKPGSAEAKGGVYQRSAAGFMGKQWDNGEAAFAVEFWAEVYRVLKPGGHVLAFSATRTYHRLACAVEDSGFEIRDQIGWLYGSGFPKSHDVSKGIQKRRVEDQEPIRAVCRVVRAAMDLAGLKSKDLAPDFDNCHPRLIDHWAARDTDSQPSLPTWEQWQQLRDTLGLGSGLDAEVWRLNGRKGTPGEAWSSAEVIGLADGVAPGLVGMRFAGDNTIRAPSAEAEQWEGWGTALKPAWEPIVMARKPLIGTIAANVLAHGTGALNIDGCRVQFAGEVGHWSAGTAAGARPGVGYGGAIKGGEQSALGRWPANIIHDGSEEVVAAFPDSDGQQGDVRGTEASQPFGGHISGEMTGRNGATARGDSGSAARFFYTAKADAADRLGSKHPTVKPLDLMQYLVRLVTPPGGLVLDPFAGTGTTGEAAFREGMRAVLIEREPEYQADIARRMELAQNPTKRAAVAKTKNNLQGAEGTPLFGDA
jgi:DNA modification methylase